MDGDLSLMKPSKLMLLMSQAGDFDHTRWLMKVDREDAYDVGMSKEDFMDKSWKPLTRKIKVPLDSYA
ncbi:Peroxidase [Psidium guajava]|nr:Peroxidase [Psidium guajava]